MKLHRIHFYAYKSLVDTTLELPDSCIGLVGPNESGKSNILEATRKLSSLDKLSSEALPRMKRMNSCNPYVSFEFVPTDDEKISIINIINQWESFPAKYSTDNISDYSFVVHYNVEYDIQQRSEFRYFTISGLEIDSNILFRDSEITESYPVKIDDENITFNNALFITKQQLEENAEIPLLNEKIAENNNKIITLKDELNNLTQIASANQESTEEGEITEDAVTEGEVKSENIIDEKEIEIIQKKISELKEENNGLLIKTSAAPG